MAAVDDVLAGRAEELAAEAAKARASHAKKLADLAELEGKRGQLEDQRNTLNGAIDELARMLAAEEDVVCRMEHEARVLAMRAGTYDKGR